MTTTTTRRTTKITQPARGYVAIQCDYVSAATTRIACVAKCDMTIEGTNGASVDLKAGEAFWLVRSESLGENMFYIVREEIGVKRCSCPANKPCKHETGLKAYIAEHGRSPLHLRAREIAAEASKAKAAQIAEEAEQSRDLFAVAAANAAQAGPAIDKALIASTAQSDRRLASTLNGNRGFSLLAR